MRRSNIVVQGIAMTALLFGCGRSSDEGAAAPSPVAPSTTVADAEPELYTTESGLECPQNQFESGQYEPGMADPSAGFGELTAAAADYWVNGDGQYRDDRGALTEIVEPPVVRYDNVRGETQLILSFVQVEGRWLLDFGEGCSYAPPLPPGVELDDVRDSVGAVTSARLLIPEELSSFDSFRAELDRQRFSVMQPGELGFDVLIAYRETPQCGNPPIVTIDGDRSELHVSIKTPVSGDCASIEYDRVIGIDLVAEFERTPITID